MTPPDVDRSPRKRYYVYTKEPHMGKLKSVGVREFRNNASAYLSGSEPIAVNRHGKVIGFYIPLERDEDEVRRAVRSSDRPSRRSSKSHA